MAANNSNLSVDHHPMLQQHPGYENARCDACRQSCPRCMRCLVPLYLPLWHNDGCTRPHRAWMHCCNYMYQLRDSPA